MNFFFARAGGGAGAGGAGRVCGDFWEKGLGIGKCNLRFEI